MSSTLIVTVANGAFAIVEQFERGSFADHVSYDVVQNVQRTRYGYSYDLVETFDTEPEAWQLLHRLAGDVPAQASGYQRERAGGRR